MVEDSTAGIPVFGQVVTPSPEELPVASSSAVSSEPRRSYRQQEGALIDVDPDQPWASWMRPRILVGDVGNLRAEVEGPEDQQHVVLKHGDERLGFFTDRALRELGWRTKFPADFVETLSPALQASVINERVTTSRDKDLGIVIEGGRFTNVIPGWRDPAGYGEIAQTAYNTLQTVYREVEVTRADLTDLGIKCRFRVPVTEKITARKGDVLQLGLEVTSCYGGGTELAAYVERLVCVNGMTASRREFDWKTRNSSTPEHQLNWVVLAIETCLDGFRNLVTRARRMSQVRIEGDIEAVIREHARAMRLPQRHWPALLNAWENERDATEWGILNAFTSLGTHGGLSPRTSRAVLDTSGAWVEEFDIVTCRLPRPIALQLGAEMVGE